MKTRRDTIRLAITGMVTSAAIGNEWVKPIINHVLIPSHAQTSPEACSSATETIVDEMLTLTVTRATVEGPITATRNGLRFSSQQELRQSGCLENSALLSRVLFEGEIDSTTNSIEGVLQITQTCGGAFVSEQLTNFTVTQSTVVNSDEGEYTGALIGTLRSCNDF